MSSYDCLDLERVRWGESLEEAIDAELVRRQARRALVVASRSCRQASPVIDAMATGDPRFVGIFDEVVAHVSRESVISLVDRCRGDDVDLLVTIGGGSPIDTAKVALLALAGGIREAGELDALRIRVNADGSRSMPALPPPPFRQVVAPTTLAGAEYSDLAGCTETVSKVKQLFSAKGIGSATVIMAPEMTLSTPLDIWLSTGIRALDHAVETLCSLGSNPYADALSIQAIAALAPALRATKASPQDCEPRRQAQFAVWLACAGLNRVPWGASHGVGHQIGAVGGIPHGYCSCILLPHVLAHNRPINGDRQAVVADALGRPGDPAAEAVRDLIVELGLPTRLRDVGIARDALPTIAETSLDNAFVRQNPRPLRTPDDILKILEAAF